MADIHGIPSEADVTPVQSFTSEPLPDIGPVFDQANAAAGAGVLYPLSDRQRETETLLASPQGYGAFSITGGYSGGGGENWPSDAGPVAVMENPVQGSGDYPGTTQDGLQKYGTS
jgi:hypothetical protein